MEEDAEQYGLLTVNPMLSPLVRQWMEESTNDFSYSSGVQTIPEGRLILSVVCGRSADQDSAERKEENQASVQVPPSILNNGTALDSWKQHVGIGMVG